MNKQALLKAHKEYKAFLDNNKEYIKTTAGIYAFALLLNVSIYGFICWVFGWNFYSSYFMYAYLGFMAIKGIYRYFTLDQKE